MTRLDRITELAHLFVGLALDYGDWAVDATAGKGNDTLFLAQKVGPSGQVYAFDVQEEALKVTAGKLKLKNLEKRVTLLHCGHQFMRKTVNGPVSAIMYNLGFLPGGNREIKTSSRSTLESLDQALLMVRKGGIITVAIYPGHKQGSLEKTAVLRFCQNLPPADYTVLHLNVLNRKKDPPELVVIRKIT